MGEREFTGTSFYQFLGENRLMGSRCQSCGVLHLPPRAICPACYGEELGWVELSGEGKLLVEGPAISAQILGVDPAKPEEIQLGTPLRVTFVPRGEGDQARTYLAFEPA
jgi:uncharacterized OB-fold protein